MHRTVLALLIGLGGQAQAPSPLPDRQQPFLVSVNVDLVVLNATVSDRKGHFVSDLRAQDFEVYEDGVRQSIQLFRHEDLPVTVGLVVDHSGSMRHKLADVVAAARTFIQFSSTDDEMFVVNFNEHVTMGLPAGIQVTNRPDELASAISHSPAIGMTALYDAVVRAREQLRSGTRDKKVLIVVSDGGDNASTHKLDAVLKMAERSSVLIYTIGIFDEGDPDRNPAVLKRLAQATGGEAFFPNELKEVVAICERIARDIRHQYALGYVPSRPAQPGGFRTIKVVAHATGQGRLVVRTRNGYIAGEGAK
ncbi:MAG TPA: VWA domain-containing protein [Bryobacteraceae bacterium]|nr:VWA domain-containing protein [Bryobacteraceae bacterium]